MGTKSIKKTIIIIAVISVIIFTLVCGFSWKNNITDQDWIKESIYTLKDGSVVDLYGKDSGEERVSYVLENSADYIYCDDELLLIEYPFHFINYEKFDFHSITETTEGKINEYYENMGILYDIEDELESALLDPDYHSIIQTRASMTSNKDYLFIETYITRYYNGAPANMFFFDTECCEISLWDIKTGELTEFKDIFKLSPDETVKTILGNADIEVEKFSNPTGTGISESYSVTDVKDYTELQELMLGKFDYDDMYSGNRSEFEIEWIVSDDLKYSIKIPESVLADIFKEEFVPNIKSASWWYLTLELNCYIICIPRNQIN